MSTTNSRHDTIDPEVVAARRDDEELYVLDVREGRRVPPGTGLRRQVDDGRDGGLGSRTRARRGRIGRRRDASRPARDGLRLVPRPRRRRRRGPRPEPLRRRVPERRRRPGRRNRRRPRHARPRRWRTATGSPSTVGNFASTTRPATPPGSVSLDYGDALLAGDTLFIRGVGRPDLEWSDEADVRAAANDLFASLRHLATLPDETVVRPGHFADEDARPLATTLARLEAENVLFGMDDRGGFVETIVERLSEEPANYDRIKAINWGTEPLTDDAADLELGPNNCAAN